MRAACVHAAIACLAIGVAHGQVAGVRGVIGSGGRSMSGSGVQLKGTLGQPATGKTLGTALSCSGGFWHTIGAGGQAADGAVLPTRYDLSRSHPNPFASTTALMYALPSAADVRLAVYNAEGRLVTELVNGPHAAGTYAVTLNGDQLAPGVYLCRLEAGGFQATRPVVLIR